MSTANVYENLYNNMKNRFTVVNENCEYTLGDYMLIKAGKKKETKSNLPATKTNHSGDKAIVAFVKYVNDKLTVKAPPVKDKTIKSFPFRTSAAAFLCAILTCTLVISFGSVTMRSIGESAPATMNVGEVIEDAENEESNIDQK